MVAGVPLRAHRRAPPGLSGGGRTGARLVAAGLLAIAVQALALAAPARAETARSVRRKMGSRFEVTAVHSDAAAAWSAV